MNTAALVGPCHAERVLAWENGHSITYGHFLSDVGTLADLLPEKPTVINLADDRCSLKMCGQRWRRFHHRACLSPRLYTSGLVSPLARGFLMWSAFSLRPRLFLARWRNKPRPCSTPACMRYTDSRRRGVLREADCRRGCLARVGWYHAASGISRVFPAGAIPARADPLS